MGAMKWAQSKPTTPGVYYQRGHYLGRPDIWELREILLNAQGHLVVNDNAFSPENVYEMTPLEHWSDDFYWFGPMGPAPTGKRVLKRREPRRAP